MEYIKTIVILVLFAGVVSIGLDTILSLLEIPLISYGVSIIFIVYIIKSYYFD